MVTSILSSQKSIILILATSFGCSAVINSLICRRTFCSLPGRFVTATKNEFLETTFMAAFEICAGPFLNKLVDDCTVQYALVCVPKNTCLSWYNWMTTCFSTVVTVSSATPYLFASIVKAVLDFPSFNSNFLTLNSISISFKRLRFTVPYREKISVIHLSIILVPNKVEGARRSATLNHVLIVNYPILTNNGRIPIISIDWWDAIFSDNYRNCRKWLCLRLAELTPVSVWVLNQFPICLMSDVFLYWVSRPPEVYSFYRKILVPFFSSNHYATPLTSSSTSVSSFGTSGTFFELFI